MPKSSTYSQGGDSIVIHNIANDYYGSLKAMFCAHGWTERGSKMMPAAQQRVADVYGTIQKFEATHRSDGMMPMIQSLQSDPPNVWLTSLYGFDPEDWGMLGFTKSSDRDNFIQNTKPGVLVAIYIANSESRNIVGIQQCSHEIDDASVFQSPSARVQKANDVEKKRKWNFAVKVTRAWKVTLETQISVDEFADTSYDSTKTARIIGKRGVPLIREEALRILNFDLHEVPVYGQNTTICYAPGAAKDILAPSRAGPVSQSAYITQEAESPKHLYILKLMGDADAFMGKKTDGKYIIKAGFSKDPNERCKQFNSAIPYRSCAYHWDVLYSGEKSCFKPYAHSNDAKLAEKIMHNILYTHSEGESLGGEFFLASPELIEQAWQGGNKKVR